MAIFRRHADQDPVVDLTGTDETVDVTGSSHAWGLPLPCPKCAQPGYLDRIDPAAEVMHQHCPSCLCKWETDRASLESASSSS